MKNKIIRGSFQGGPNGPGGEKYVGEGAIVMKVNQGEGLQALLIDNILIAAPKA